MDKELFKYPEGYNKVIDMLDFLPDELRTPIFTAYLDFLVAGLV